MLLSVAIDSHVPLMFTFSIDGLTLDLTLCPDHKVLRNGIRFQPVRHLIARSECWPIMRIRLIEHFECIGEILALLDLHCRLTLMMVPYSVQDKCWISLPPNITHPLALLYHDCRDIHLLEPCRYLQTILAGTDFQTLSNTVTIVSNVHIPMRTWGSASTLAFRSCKTSLQASV